MMISLYSAATGMSAQQFKLDTIANNLANVDTTGYKKVRAEFQDLLYQYVKNAGTPTAATSSLPTGLYVGHGVRTAATTRIFTLGNFEQTGNALDLAIAGDGFFQIQLQDGRIAYTRDGSFKIDSEGRIVTSNGLLLVPEITIPENAVSINVSPDGIVSAELQDGTIQELGTITLVRFVNPSGLKSIGDNLYIATPASGDPIEGVPGQDGFGAIKQGFLEKSNVDVVREMVDMITAQRAYEFNSRVIQTADEMLRTATNVKR
ncbi:MULTISPECIES: flagellar basal-body rod protein FlgG [Thermotoga]|jgi:flagellar basal-body rod protein FlgG|nr:MULTISPECIES: flagellar basal-body rod protein FlgG [unclassified Thermotoga]HAA82991.1 flagellar basal-body rod protein FlgG [Thermotoga petrophila]ACB09549.1 flagellar basal-body rod protein FlgG [Thermotoga sp. RQ2]AIY88582.1 flagellar basal-body rod protein FlgG [Thermotoga sp. Cell2]KHC94751.1 flagellar basal-body rod protein FlgG [Thermotoga sp. TBGT1765]KHC95000.1 flagellar basal-body rod protein FlgG [Thermotoga sp. TBGT1766]